MKQNFPKLGDCFPCIQLLRQALGSKIDVYLFDLRSAERNRHIGSLTRVWDSERRIDILVDLTIPIDRLDLILYLTAYQILEHTLIKRGVSPSVIEKKLGEFEAAVDVYEEEEEVYEMEPSDWLNSDGVETYSIEFNGFEMEEVSSAIWWEHFRN